MPGLVPLYVSGGLPPIVEVSGQGLDASDNLATDGTQVKTWRAVDSSISFVQNTAGDRANSNDDAYDGAWSLIFNTTDHYFATVPEDVKWILVIVRRGDRAVLSRDTDATTTKPAFQLSVENG